MPDLENRRASIFTEDGHTSITDAELLGGTESVFEALHKDVVVHPSLTRYREVCKRMEKPEPELYAPLVGLYHITSTGSSSQPEVDTTRPDTEVLG